MHDPTSLSQPTTSLATNTRPLARPHLLHAEGSPRELLLQAHQPSPAQPSSPHPRRNYLYTYLHSSPLEATSTPPSYVPYREPHLTSLGSSNTANLLQSSSLLLLLVHTFLSLFFVRFSSSSSLRPSFSSLPPRPDNQAILCNPARPRSFILSLPAAACKRSRSISACLLACLPAALPWNLRLLPARYICQQHHHHMRYLSQHFPTS